MQLKQSHLDKQWGSTKVIRGRAPRSSQFFPNCVKIPVPPSPCLSHSLQFPVPFHPHDLIGFPSGSGRWAGQESSSPIHR